MVLVIRFQSKKKLQNNEKIIIHKLHKKVSNILILIRGRGALKCKYYTKTKKNKTRENMKNETK